MLANVARNNTVASRKPTTFASIQAKSSQNFSSSSFSSSFAFTSKNKINIHNKLNTSKNQILGQKIHTPSNSSGSLKTLNNTTKTNSTANSAAAIHSSSSQKQSAAAAAAAKPAEESANFNFSLGKNDPYPSRVFNDPQVIDRRDPVVWPRNESLNLPSEPLSQQELQEYRDNGFLVMRNVLSQDVVSRCRDDIQSMINKFENRGDSRVTSDVKYVTEPGSGTLRSIFETHKDTQHHIGHVVRRPEILNRARQILQDEIYVHQSRINFHRAFKGTGFSWHSDFETWHVEDGIPGMRALSCVVFLTNNDSANGALMVIPGSHKKFISCVGETPENNWETSLKHQQEIGVPDGNNLRRMAALARENGTEDMNIVHAAGRPGDVLFFDCNLLHGSHSNISPFDRTNAFFVLNAMSNKIQDIPNPRPEHIACRDPKYVKPLTPIEDEE